MTPEERAQDIFDRIVRLGKYRDVGVAYEPIPLIAEHIRQARAEGFNAGVDAAADLFAKSTSPLKGPIMDKIRALKESTPEGD